MIQYKHGDIVQAMLDTCDIDIVCHQCNAFCVHGAGVAKGLSQVFPEILAADNTTRPGDRSKMGSFTSAVVKNQFNHQMQVFNLYGQYAFRYGTIYRNIDGIKHSWDIPIERQNNGELMPMTDLRMLRQAIERMIEDVSSRCEIRDVRFATVKIGSGRGGANWEREVYPMLLQLFGGLNLTVYRF